MMVQSDHISCAQCYDALCTRSSTTYRIDRETYTIESHTTKGYLTSPQPPTSPDSFGLLSESMNKAEKHSAEASCATIVDALRK